MILSMKYVGIYIFQLKSLSESKILPYCRATLALLFMEWTHVRFLSIVSLFQPLKPRLVSMRKRPSFNALRYILSLICDAKHNCPLLMFNV